MQSALQRTLSLPPLGSSRTEIHPGDVRNLPPHNGRGEPAHHTTAESRKNRIRIGHIKITIAHRRKLFKTVSTLRADCLLQTCHIVRHEVVFQTVGARLQEIFDATLQPINNLVPPAYIVPLIAVDVEISK